MIPETRSEQYLASIIGEEVELPVPQSRIEHYLNIIAQNGVAPSSAGLINYDPDASYPDGSIGKEVHELDGDVSELKSEIDDITEYGGIEKSLELTWNPGSINSATGEIGPTTSWWYTQLIPASFLNGAKYTNDAATVSSIYAYEYHSDGSYSKTLTTIAATNSYTFPDNYAPDGKFVRLSLSWRCYSNASLVNVAQTLATVEDLTAVKDFPIMVLPPAVYAVEGADMNIYTDNVLLGNYGDYGISWWVNSINWQDEYSDRFNVHPGTGNKGDYTIYFVIANKKNWDYLSRKQIPLHVFENKTLTGKSVLFIGDSLTNAGYFAYEIQHNLSNEGVISIGTIESHPWFDDTQVSVYAEGRGGWSAHNYVTDASRGGTTNAFWNPSTSQFDFSYYLSNNSLSAPDIVFITLGTNGIEDAAGEVAAINEMITSIHAHTATLPIVISLTTPSAMQDGWTAVTHGGSVDRFKWLQLMLVKAYIEAFAGRENEYIYVAPTYTNIDRQHDFPYTEADCSARNPYKVYRQTDNVHMSKYGYFKMADVFWAMIQKILS